jgi:murein L,D-transpeptidase YafK
MYRYSALIAILLIVLLAVTGGNFAQASGLGLPEQRIESPRADYILIDKSERRMTLYQNGEPIRLYRVSLGKGGLDPKRRQGDKLTPEGLYRINGRNPNSAYHLSLRISYPGPQDKLRAAAKGVSPGGDIMIHGIGPGLTWLERQTYPFKDWTAGCVAVTDSEIEEIWRIVPDGTPVEIRP